MEKINSFPLERLCRNGKNAVIPAKLVPAGFKPGAGIQGFEIVDV